MHKMFRFFTSEKFCVPARVMRIGLACLAVIAIVLIAIILITPQPNNTPETIWQPETRGTASVDFGEVMEISAFQFLIGYDGSRPFMIAASVDGRSWRTLYYSQSTHPTFQWLRIEFEAYTEARFVEIIPFGTQGIKIAEAGFRNELGEILSTYYISSGAEALFDEQHLIPKR